MNKISKIVYHGYYQIHGNGYKPVVESVAKHIIKVCNKAPSCYKAPMYATRKFRKGNFEHPDSYLRYTVSVGPGPFVDVICKHVPKARSKKENTMYFHFTEDGLVDSSAAMSKLIQHELVMEIFPAFVEHWMGKVHAQCRIPMDVLESVDQVCEVLDNIDNYLDYFEVKNA